ncbi:uncharacterized protein LOC122289242 [Carya illinoinensis]|uniref:uncharacterized protein LOC122289242 n=1 Tax=Carya illinoinensis TaxID=32201 RepID=UPI001C7251AC|nr:uncharacterized protein LOC122289242 [Carya illinoinensis]
MDALSRMLSAAVSGGFIAGFSVGGLSISHLLFADDTLLFCEPDSVHMQYLRAVLLCFEAVSGLKVNLSKSEMVPVGSVNNIQDLASILGCQISSLPLQYLGLPLGAAFKTKSIWDGVIEKIERRLARWKRLYLSKGGKWTLIKSTLSNLPTFIIGSGNNVSFWHDVWCGDMALKQAFPMLYQIACNKEAAVADLLTRSNADIHWNVIFSRAAQDWELDMLSGFFDSLYATSFGNVMRDRLVWKPSASIGRILTSDNLRKRGFIISDWCYMCKCDGESVDHLLLHCEVARSLWHDVFSRVGVAWVMPRSVRDLMCCWKGIRENAQIAAVWKMIPHCIMWCVWLERNKRCFEDMELSMAELKRFFYYTLLSWALAIICNTDDLHSLLVTLTSS